MPRYFLVFQGDTYDEEKELSCLWAPKKNKSGNEVHHHKRLLEVNEGDRVIHLVNRYIKAISTVSQKLMMLNAQENLNVLLGIEKVEKSM